MNKLLRISCDSFEFNSALLKLDPETLRYSITKFMDYISDDKNKVSREDLKQLAKNVSIVDDPAKTT